MDEEDRRCLQGLVEQVRDNTLDDVDWSRADRAFASIEESLRNGTGDWLPARDELFDLLSTRASKGLRESLDGQGRKPAPQQTRDLAIRLLHRLGLPPSETRHADDPA
jgi:hypothetical protein